MPAALVTGATRGLGHALAFDFAREGYVVYATGRSGDALDALAREAHGAKLDVRTLPSDVATVEGEDPKSVPAPEERTGVFLWLARTGGMEATGNRYEAEGFR
jgi:short-subunit dehydrogenase